MSLSIDKDVVHTCRGQQSVHSFKKGLLSKEAAVLRLWGVETNVWFINRVDN